MYQKGFSNSARSARQIWSAAAESRLCGTATPLWISKQSGGVLISILESGLRHAPCPDNDNNCTSPTSSRYILSPMLKYGLVLCGAGLAMLITGLLPQDKLDKVRASLGDKRQFEGQPSARMQLLTCGAICLFFGLLLLGVIRL